MRVLHGPFRKPLELMYCGLLLFALLVSIHRDIRNNEALPIDLRNRMVGARMLSDGYSPYFYIWKEGGPIRYYDTYIPPNLNVSYATSTPFFHLLMAAFADMPQYQLNIWWLIIEYLSLIGCLFFAMHLVSNGKRKREFYLAALLTVAFTYTDGWRMHVYAGQNYIFIPLLGLACIYWLRHKPIAFYLLLFAICAVSLILLRPITALLFVPMFFYAKKYFKWGLVTCIAMIAYIILVWYNPVQKLNWSEYFKSIAVNVDNQQGLTKFENIPYNPLPILDFEGVSLRPIVDSNWAQPAYVAPERSNFFVFYEAITNHRISVKAMTLIASIVCLFLLSPLLYYVKRKVELSDFLLLMLGFVIYNVYDFFTPIQRLGYHWVQFLFPLLLLLTCQKKWLLMPWAVIVLGLLLNMGLFPFIKMQHNIGEGLIVLSILYFIYRSLIIVEERELRYKIDGALYWI